MILAMAAGACVASTAQATTITWDFGTTTPVATPDGGSTSDFTGGTASSNNNNGTVSTPINTTSASTTYAGASGQENIGAAARTGVLNTTAGTGSAYLAFSLTPTASNSTVAFSEFDFGSRSTNTGPASFQLQYSTDGTTFTNLGNAGTLTVTGNPWALYADTFSLSLSSSTTVSFRLYGFGGSGTTTSGTENWRTDDWKLTYTVTPNNTATSYFWTANGSTLGGSGTWSSTSTTWSTSDTTVSGAAVNPLSQVGVFKGTAGTVTVSGTVEADAGLQFSTTSYSLSGGALTLGGATAAANTITTDPNVSTTISTALTAANGWTKAGTGTLSLTSSSNSFAGGTTLNAGILNFTTGALGSSGNITFTGGTLQYGSSTTTDLSSRIVSSSNAIAIDTGGNDVMFASALASSNTGGLNKLGSGTLTLGTTNNYSGGTTFTGGTVSIAADAALGSGNLTFNGGTLLTSAGVTSSRTITNNAGGGTIDDGGNTDSFSGALAGTGAFTKAGSGTTTISGFAATTTTLGVVNVSAGTLNLIGGTATSGNPSNSTVAIAGGAVSGTLGLGTTIAGNALRLNSTANITGNGSINIATGGSIVATAAGVAVAPAIGISGIGGSIYLGANSGDSLTLNGAITGSAGVVFSSGFVTTGTAGTGTITLGTANSYLGDTTIALQVASATGTLVLGVDDALPTATNLSFNSASGAVNLAGHSQHVASISSTGGTIPAGITNTGGTQATLTINGTSSTTFNAPIGAASGVASSNGNIAVVLASGNSGTLALSGANSYSGGTTINGGTLLANSTDTTNGSTGSGAVNVNNTGTLGGTGNVKGAVNVNNGGTITANTVSSSGTLTTGAETWSNGGTYVWNINNATGTAGGASGWDLLSFTSLGIMLGNGETFTIKIVGNAIANFDHTKPFTFKIASGAAGSVSGFDASRFVLNTDGFTNNGLTTGDFFAVTESSDGSELDLSYVPEPSTLGVVAIACGTTLLSRRRRRRSRSSR
jgi:autotransporter-associated beta strand protein